MPPFYRRIYVPVDSSGYSFAAIDLAVALAGRFDARIIGSHVSGSGNSDSHLDLLEDCCRNASIEFERRSLDGRHYRMILEDICGDGCDLVIMGGLGEGSVGDSQIGSVTERVVRKAATDVLVVKDLLPDEEAPILAAIDGSSQSLEALGAALEFGRATGRPVEGIVVGEGALAGDASAAIESARFAAAAEGRGIELTVAEGKPFDRILQACRQKKPWLLVLGKTGADAEAGEDLGSTAGNLLRLAPCNILLTPGLPTERGFVPPDQALVEWDEGAGRLLADVPDEQRAEVIRTVEEAARKMGVSVITAETIDKVMLGYIDS